MYWNFVAIDGVIKNQLISGAVQKSDYWAFHISRGWNWPQVVFHVMASGFQLLAANITLTRISCKCLCKLPSQWMGLAQSKCLLYKQELRLATNPFPQEFSLRTSGLSHRRNGWVNKKVKNELQSVMTVASICPRTALWEIRFSR
jgi:hypothetical protein